jgi:hypothetical protein
MENETTLNVMYFHGKTTDEYRFTIAGVIDRGYLNMGISLCSRRDNFVKSRGRAIATERVLSERNWRSLGKSVCNLHITKSSFYNPSDSTSNAHAYFVGHEFGVFTEIASYFNDVSKKRLLRIFNLKNHKPQPPF